MISKIILFTILAVVNSMYLEESYHPHYIFEDADIMQDDLEDHLSELNDEEFNHHRDRRQVDFSAAAVEESRVKMSGSENLDKTRNYDLNVRLAGDQDSTAKLNAFGSVAGLNSNGGYKDANAGLLLESNRNALGASVRDIPSFGKQLTGAGKVNLFHNDNHNLDTNAFVTRNLPNVPNFPNYNTYGGNLDYNYKDRIGATLSASRTPLFQQTDMSAMGKVNLFKDNVSSFDFRGGASRSISPFRPSSSWQPSFGFSYNRSF